jgi:hypothetical protein
MRSLCWKELRENVKWALLAMVALGVGEMYALYHTDNGQPDYDYNSGITLCKTTFLMVTTFGSAAVGFVLGLLQILPELRRDQWAALLHRPVPRSVIFLGKAAAGLLLYALATVPPFLLSVWLVATPGHFATPFVPGLMLPGVADICTGAVYYFAALALALQRDKWVGLRAFPLLAAFHCSGFVTSSKFFYVALEAAILMGIALCAAGWGTMLNQEKFSARPWLGRLAFLAMVYYGVCGFGDLGESILKVMGPSSHSHYVRYELSDKGVPLRLTYDDNICVSVTDPDGHPVTDPDYRPSRVRSHLSYMNGVSSNIGDAHGWKEEPFVRSYRDSAAYLWRAISYTYPKFEQWFYLEQKGSLVCIPVPQNKAIARFDQGGFEPVTAEPRPFLPETDWEQSDSEEQIIVWDGKSLSLVSLAKRESIDLPLQGRGPVFGIGTASSEDSGGNSSVIGVALPDRMAVYDDATGAQVASLPYHQNVDRWGQLEMGVNGGAERFYIRYMPSAWIDGKTRDGMPSYMEEMNRQGEVLHTWTLPSLPPFQRSESLGNFLAQRLSSPAFFFGNMAYQKLGAALGSERLGNLLASRFGKNRLTWEIALYVVSLSLALAATTLLWARSVYFSWPRAVAWAAFVFLFNVAGFITFRLAADWPRMAACPRCGRSRPIDEDLCPHCGAAWPEPQMEGTEVFDGAAGAGAGA